MRTNFNIKTRGSRKSGAQKRVIVIVLIVIVITSLQAFKINPLGGFLHSALQPVLTGEHRLADEIDKYITLLLSKRSLVERNNGLEDRLKELEPSALLVDALREENSELKSLLNRDVSTSTILAAVLAKPSVSLYDTIIVDVGASNNITEGDLVLVYSDFAIGTVTEVYGKTSLVTLFSSGGRKSDVTLGDEHLLVEATGRGGGNFVTRLPRGIEISTGDIVVLPNISTQIFGVVERVVVAPADQFQTILFKNPINMAEVKWVEIIRNKI